MNYFECIVSTFSLRACSCYDNFFNIWIYLILILDRLKFSSKVYVRLINAFDPHRFFI